MLLLSRYPQLLGIEGRKSIRCQEKISSIESAGNIITMGVARYFEPIKSRLELGSVLIVGINIEQLGIQILCWSLHEVALSESNKML
mmetsp:Transcript_8204/g.18418  ORF Transcript_8204/g.18418 Transcript_8204/m.18418 type:complete len:87 (+) Transcript_8204:242-502(+)